MTVLSFADDECNLGIPTPREIQDKIPLTDKQAGFVHASRETVKSILNGSDPRLLLIVGPCSIHDQGATREYAERFRHLSNKVSDQFFLVMRSYLEKPRTIVGWKGILYDPDLDGSYNLSKGIQISRKLLSELTELEVPVGSEFLELNTSHYYSDFVSWGCIGARTCCSPPHRQLAATLPLPIGFKNSTDGNIDNPIHAILSAESPHAFLGVSANGQMSRIQTEGNSLCHLVMRGGTSGPNYGPDEIKKTVSKCQKAGVRDKLIIDCSHDNCGKRHAHQISVFNSVLQQIIEGNHHIRGMMLESFLHAGSQPIHENLRYGISITDPCLDWETTEELILDAYVKIQKSILCCV